MYRSSVVIEANKDRFEWRWIALQVQVGAGKKVGRFELDIHTLDRKRLLQLREAGRQCGDSAGCVSVHGYEPYPLLWVRTLPEPAFGAGYDQVASQLTETDESQLIV